MADSTEKLEAALGCLPIFPLPDMVFFPGVRLPLHVFEPRYRVMIQECLATHGALAIARLLPGEDERGFPRIASVVGGGIIAEHHTLPDGRANILVEGLARLELRELPFAGPYRRARATRLVDDGGRVSDADRAALVSAASSFARLVHAHDRSFSFELPVELDAAHLADACAFQLVADPQVRQNLLEELRPAWRVRTVTEVLMVQASALRRPRGGGQLVN